ncbi:hypothetical protein D3C84_597280 [compost metagenome]
MNGAMKVYMPRLDTAASRETKRMVITFLSASKESLRWSVIPGPAGITGSLTSNPNHAAAPSSATSHSAACHPD